MSPITIRWFNNDLFTVDKPAGLSVFPLHANPEGDCLLHRITEAGLSALESWPAAYSGGIAHRLDIPTSGQIVVAKHRSGLEDLRHLFQSKQLIKRYRFLTAKPVSWTQHRNDRPLAHDRKQKRRMVVQRGNQTPHRGKWLPAVTEFQYIGPVQGGLHGWEASMSTGVMHQIRLHAASIGLALVGDRLYGGGAWDFPRPDGAHFALHHIGIKGPGLQPCEAPLPDWWPQPLPSSP